MHTPPKRKAKPSTLRAIDRRAIQFARRHNLYILVRREPHQWSVYSTITGKHMAIIKKPAMPALVAMAMRTNG